MAEVKAIIAIGWFACLFVTVYNDLAWTAKVKARKPFSCQSCMGFWFGLLFAACEIKGLMDVLIFSTLTSLTATILNAVARRI